MKLIETKIPGFFKIRPQIHEDNRGNFVKIFQKSVYSKYFAETDFVEEYYSSSVKGVVRGLHFQLPPHDLAKVVCCLRGKIFDVVLDMRIGSPTYGNYETVILEANENSLLYIPSGLAHGFCVLSDNASLLYKVTAEYSAEHDSGILWNSVSIHWPINNPIISKRDANFVSFDSFKSPFTYKNIEK